MSPILSYRIYGVHRKLLCTEWAVERGLVRVTNLVRFAMVFRLSYDSMQYDMMLNNTRNDNLVANHVSLCMAVDMYVRSNSRWALTVRL